MISVIIPVYNGVRFIRRCYESLIKQTIEEWEAVFIDDGSSDDSFDELKKLSESDPRVKIIHKNNEGVAVAREVGIREAKGEYVTFLDVDDTLVDSALEQFVVHFDHEDTDMVVAGINMVSENSVLLRKIYYRNMVISGSECVDLMCIGLLRWQLCGKAFRTTVIKTALTPRGLRSAEDMAVCVQAALKSRVVNVLNTCLYNYVQVATSVTHSKALEISKDALEAARFVKRTVGAEMNPISLDCLFLLITSTALRAGISVDDDNFRETINEHGRLKSIRQLPLLKAVSVGLYRFFNINLARFL